MSHTWRGRRRGLLKGIGPQPGATVVRSKYAALYPWERAAREIFLIIGGILVFSYGKNTPWGNRRDQRILSGRTRNDMIRLRRFICLWHELSAWVVYQHQHCCINFISDHIHLCIVSSPFVTIDHIIDRTIYTAATGIHVLFATSTVYIFINASNNDGHHIIIQWEWHMWCYHTLLHTTVAQHTTVAHSLCSCDADWCRE